MEPVARCGELGELLAVIVGPEIGPVDCRDVVRRVSSESVVVRETNGSGTEIGLVGCRGWTVPVVVDVRVPAGLSFVGCRSRALCDVVVVRATGIVLVMVGLLVLVATGNAPVFCRNTTREVDPARSPSGAERGS